jgi:hypothetical protein
MHFGDSRFKHVSGSYDYWDSAKTTELDLSVADANVGTTQKGKGVTLKDNDETELAYAEVGDFFLGFMHHSINLSGTTDETGFKEFTIGKLDIPKKRGSPVSIVLPAPGSIWEFEGTGITSVDNLVTDSGTGLLATGSTLRSPLTQKNGCWQIAVATDVIHAHLLQANLTPENAAEVRIRVQICSPHLFVTET